LDAAEILECYLVRFIFAFHIGLEHGSCVNRIRVVSTVLLDMVVVTMMGLSNCRIGWTVDAQRIQEILLVALPWYQFRQIQISLVPSWTVHYFKQKIISKSHNSYKCLFYPLGPSGGTLKS